MAAYRIYSAAVERPVKERLVGAAVLVAAAVILIPEMLSGPQREQRVQSTVRGQEQDGEAPLKTYTIDLSQSPTAKSAAENSTPKVIEAPAPPPEIAAPPEEPAAAASSQTAAIPQASPESAPVENAPGDATSEPDPAPSADNVAPPPAPRETPSRNEKAAEKAGEPVAAEAVAQKNAGKTAAAKGWAVQLASFDEEAGANALSKRLREQGYDAFVMPFKKGGANWYRVRVGPVKTREAANELLRKVKETTPGAIVVPHP